MLPGGNKTVKRERSEDRAYGVADASELPALRSGTGCSLLAGCVRPSVWCDRDLHDPFTRGMLASSFLPAKYDPPHKNRHIARFLVYAMNAGISILVTLARRIQDARLQVPSVDKQKASR